MKTTRRPIASAIVAATALLGLTVLAGCGGDEGASSGSGEPKIRVAIQPTTTALPLVVADKKGFFKKRGADVSWKVSNVNISDQLSSLGRQTEIAMGTQPALISAVAQRIQLVNITGGAFDTDKSPTANIIAGKQSGITSLKQLEGKRVGALTLTGNIHYALLNALEAQGVDTASIKWVVGTPPTLPDQLRAGRVDAIEEIEPFAGMAVANGGVALGDPFRSLGDRSYISIWLAQEDWANDNQDAVRRFAQAMDDAAKWVQSHRGEAKQVLSSYTGLKGEVLDRTPIPEFHFSTSGQDLSAQHTNELAEWVNVLQRTSNFRAPVKAEDMLPEWAG